MPCQDPAPTWQIPARICMAYGYNQVFDTVDHRVLASCLNRRLPGGQLLWLSGVVIDSFCHHSHGGRKKGMPIGNLTSQIFSNIYLHELDRYVRHTLRPLAYVRYGDDVVVWCRTRREARSIRQRTVEYLATELYLAVNPKNDVIVPASAGLHFLGHVVTSSYVVVDRHTTKLVLAKVNSSNIASYKSLLLAKVPKTQLDWQYVGQLDRLDY